MSVSSDIKDYLNSGVKRNACCVAAFECGKECKIFKELCPACRASFIAGVFVSCGTVTDPEKGYHLDMKVPHGLAGRIASILDEEGLTPRACNMQSGKVRLYYKASGMISDFLTYIGAMKFALEVVQSEVIKSIRSKESRKFNAELANIDRAATAAAEQMRAIEFLKKHGALNALPEELVQTAKIREENPFMPLGELCTVFSPPISKSGLSHRLKRITEEANKLKRQLDL